ncbi:unnamed protein product [Urochloa humidicola]
MACTKLTPRKSTCHFLPPRVHERDLVSSYRDAYQAWRRHYDEAVRQQVAAGVQDEPEEVEEEDPEEVEQEPEEQEQPGQEHPDQEQQVVAGGGPGGDPDDDDDDEEEEDEDEEDGDHGGEVERPPRWIIHDYTRDGGDSYYHRRLLKMLQRHYGMGYVGVSYHCKWWTHDRFPSFWRVKVQVRVPDPSARAAKRMTQHSALSDRETIEAGIGDAAHQAYFRYRHELWLEIQERADRYHPRRASGETACTIATTVEVTDRQLASTVSLVAVLNMDVDALSDGNHLLRTWVTELQERIIEMESQAGLPAPRSPEGLPAPRSPEHHAESPPRKRARYGTAEARTTIEAP